MTNEQINEAIETVLHRNEHWIISRDYCSDLNAMHEAEKGIQNLDLYEEWLEDVWGGTSYLFNATARQRAEAFLKTLGKWEEAAVKGSLSTQSAFPPETRITVNGKTFCLADIDKEMTE